MEKNYFLTSEKDIHLKKWSIKDDRVKLEYEDGTVLFIKRSDFDRAFGDIVSATKDEILQKFAR